MKTRKGIGGFTSTGTIGRIFVTVTHLIVAANYALGAYMACIVGKQIYIQFASYCVIFTYLWLYSACKCWKLITKTIEIGILDDDSDEEEEDDFDEEIDYMYGNMNSNVTHDDSAGDSSDSNGGIISRKSQF